MGKICLEYAISIKKIRFMPNRNNEERLPYVYRVDSRPPDEVFQNGFTPWGRNLNYIDHITGSSNLWRLTHSLQPNDGFISTAGSISAALRFLTAQIRADNPFWQNVWIYEIRADFNFFPAQSTGTRMLSDIRTRTITFQDPEEREEAIHILQNVVRRLTYQREYMSVGPITANRVVQAWRVLITTVRGRGRDTRYFPQLDDNPIVNPHYNAPPTFTNVLPFAPEFDRRAIRHFRLPDEGAMADAGVGAVLGGGLSCNPDHPQTKLVKFSEKEQSQENKVDLPTKDICAGIDNGALKYTIFRNTVVFQNLHPIYIWEKILCYADGYNPFYLRNSTNRKGYDVCQWIYGVARPEDVVPTLFDELGRILFQARPYGSLNMALTVGYEIVDGVREIFTAPAVVNDVYQRWSWKFYNKNNEMRVQLRLNRLSDWLFAFDSYKRGSMCLVRPDVAKQSDRYKIIYSKPSDFYNLDFFTGVETPTDTLYDIALYINDPHNLEKFTTDVDNNILYNHPGPKKWLYNADNEKILWWPWIYGGEVMCLYNSRHQFGTEWKRVGWVIWDQDWTDVSRWHIAKYYDSKGHLYYRIRSVVNGDDLIVYLDEPERGWFMTVANGTTFRSSNYKFNFNVLENWL